MWNELLSCTATVYAWDVKGKPKHYAELATSMNDYTSQLPKDSKSRRQLFVSNLTSSVEEQGDSHARNNTESNDDVETQQPKEQRSLREPNSSRKIVAFGV